MARKSGQISILQVDANTINRLRVRPSSAGVEVTAYDQERGSWTDESALADALKVFARTHRLAEDELYSVLPRHTMTARILALPSNDLDEIRGMVRLGAEEFVPYPAHELVIDQCVLQKLPEGISNVLAVFAHRDVVDGHVHLMKAAGLEPHRIFISTACIASAARDAWKGGSEPYAIVNLASGGIEVLIMKDGFLAYGRGVSTTQNWDTLEDNDSEAGEELAIEVKASLSAYRRESEDGQSVEKVFICSEGANTEVAAAVLAEQTGLECAPTLFAASLVHGTIASPATLPLVSLGAALAAQQRESVAIDLVPQSLLNARAEASNRRTLIGSGLLLGCIVVALLVLYGIGTHQRNAYITQLDAEIALVADKATEVRDMQSKLTRLKEQVDRSGTALELMADVVKLMPPKNMAITKFSFARNVEITIELRVNDPAEAERFTNSLRESNELFKDASMGKIGTIQERGRTLNQLEINIPLPAPASEEEGGGQ